MNRHECERKIGEEEGLWAGGWEIYIEENIYVNKFDKANNSL